MFSVTPQFIEFISIIGIAVLSGIIVGIKRELKMKPAGLKVHIMTCVGAAIFAFISLNIDGALDKSRVIAAIVTAIGFLGAGLIWSKDDKVGGLSSATIIWAMTGIGILSGMTMFVEAIAASIVLVILDLLADIIEGKQINRKKDEKISN